MARTPLKNIPQPSTQEYSHIVGGTLANGLYSRLKSAVNNPTYAQVTSASWSVSEEPGSTTQDPLPTMTINTPDSITFTGMEGAVIEFDTPSHANVVIPEGGEITVEGFGLESGVTVTVVVNGPDERYKSETLTGVTPEREPSQDPLPYNLTVVNSGGVKTGYFVIYGMENAGVSVTYNGEEIASGIIDTAAVNPETQEPTGEYYYRNADVVDMPAVGETVTVTVTIRDYADWSTTVEVKGGK